MLAHELWRHGGSRLRQPHAVRIAAHEHSEAVVFDLVQPPSPGGRRGGWAGQAGLASRERLSDATTWGYKYRGARASRVGLVREKRLKIVLQVREEGKRCR
jgi:hypothetical protein